jgi:hypothetical protein
MEELVPVVLGVALGVMIWGGSAGGRRSVLSLCAVLVSAFAATVLSGEYQESWIYLLLDLAEATLGFALGTVIVRRWRASQAVSPPPGRTSTTERH